MNTKTISPRAISVIDQYLHFKIGNASCSVPYFNNKVGKIHFALRVYKGKGSPQEIFEEAQSLTVKNHIDINLLSNDLLRQLLVDSGIGIDCSGFAYYILDAESKERNSGTLDRHLSFTSCRGLFGKVVCSLRPVENCNVETFANNKNSRVVPIKEIVPGDIITMTGIAPIDSRDTENEIKPSQNNRDHILVIHQIEYQNFIPATIHYSHAIAYPEDGPYGSGIRQGEIQIVFPDKNIADQRWIEGENSGTTNRLFIRAQRSQTEVRRLKWL